MKLSSVRGLIAEIKSSKLSLQLETASASPGLNMISASVSQTLEAPATVTPVAIGIAKEGDEYKLAVRVQRARPGLMSVLEEIRHRAHGEVQVKMTGPVVKQGPWHQRRNRPLRMGGSIGHFRITAGTLGCFVAKKVGASNTEFVLSNNHVLANENSATKGDRILQPGPIDGGKAVDRAATLDSWVKLKTAHNLVDAAIAVVDGDIEYYYNWIESRGVLKGLRTTPLEIDETVYKVGRTTGVTEGKISAIELDDLVVGYDLGDLTFDNQIEIAPVGRQPFSLGGDSGSLVIDSKNRAIGLLFAGNDVDSTYVNPMEKVLDLLKINLVF